MSNGEGLIRMFRWLKALFGYDADNTPVTLASLQGTWRMVSVGKNGRFAPKSFLAMARICITIEGDRYKVAVNGRVDGRGTIVLDESTSPALLDRHIEVGDDAGQVRLGIVRFRHGMLEEFIAEKGCPRPKQFVRRWNDGADLAIFRSETTT